MKTKYRHRPTALTPRPDQKSRKERHYYWVVVGQMYLASALMLAKAICPDGKFRLGTAIGSLCRDLGFQSSHPNCEFIWPLVFNLKQGVELWLKGLGVMDHGQYLGVHDLKKLFAVVIANSGQNKTAVKKLHKNVWPYYYGTYNPQRKNRTHADTMSEAERFPESLKRQKRKRAGKRAVGSYKLQDPIEWVNCKVIDSIANDIRKIEKSFAEAERAIVPRKNFNY